MPHLLRISISNARSEKDLQSGLQFLKQAISRIPVVVRVPSVL